MYTRHFALVIGVVFLIVGILGFVPGATVMMHDSGNHLRVDAGYGYLLGMFPVNVVHNVVHLAFGIAGLLCFRNYFHAKRYAQTLAVVYGLVAIMGAIPAADTVGGLLP